MRDQKALTDKFFRLAWERERLRRERLHGGPPPWTSDPIFQANRFCNLYREDDKTTVWFRENMRDNPEFKQSPVLVTAAFRWFNKIEIGKVLMDQAIGLRDGQFDARAARERILFEYPNGPFVTGAYIIKTPDGMKKLDGVLWCIEQLRSRLTLFGSVPFACPRDTLEGCWNWLRQSPYLGDFMAYEVVTDLRHTPMLSAAKDIWSWANPGPGCARGISRLFSEDGDPDTWSRSNRLHRPILLDHMRTLLELSRDVREFKDRPWEMREVEHWLCEFDKYLRVEEGGRMKQKFKGTGP